MVHSTTRDTDLRELSNGQFLTSADLGSHPAGWTAVGVSDFNHDDASDILWQQNGTTHVEAWLLTNH